MTEDFKKGLATGLAIGGVTIAEGIKIAEIKEFINFVNTEKTYTDTNKCTLSFISDAPREKNKQ